MIFNIHGGHNRKVPGASGFFSEVEEDRKVKDLVINKLRQAGHVVYDCTDEIGTSQQQNLNNIVAKCNEHKVDLDVAIHFNSYNGTGHGVEAYTYDNLGSAFRAAQRIVNAIAELGFTNRGAKVNPNYFVLRKTISPAILVECCFCDNQEDSQRYNAESMATAIVKGLIEQTITSSSPSSTSANNISSSDNGFLIRTIGNMNIRSGPGVEHPIVGYICDRLKYTIVATAKANDGGTWGKLKTGKGWINISPKFVTRV